MLDQTGSNSKNATKNDLGAEGREFESRRPDQSNQGLAGIRLQGLAHLGARQASSARHPACLYCRRMKIRTIWRHMQAHPRTTWVAVLCLVFFAGLILPRIYDMKLRFPEQSEIRITEGFATFKSVGKSRAALLVVDGQEYVCAGPAYASPNCFVGKVAQVREAMEGKS
ncbi:hypothetical protein WJ972_16810 [Achromobacter insuavis]